MLFCQVAQMKSLREVWCPSGELDGITHRRGNNDLDRLWE
jgi:hypothetical protein